MIHLMLLLLPLQVTGGVMPQQTRTTQTPAAVATTPAQQNTKVGVVRGHVYASDTGSPLKHADVDLRPNAKFQPQRISTDAQGGFEFRSVDPGTYTLGCSKSGYIGASYGSKGPGQAASTFTVGESQEVNDIDCRMQHGGVITGTITNDDGEPVVYATVQVMAKTYRNGQPQLQMRSSGQTDDRGQYRIFDLAPGRYYVQVQRRGAGPSSSENVAYATVIYPNAMRLSDAQAMQLAPGAELAGINMMLRTVSTFSVSGKVMDIQSGGPVAGGMVQATAEDFMMNGANRRAYWNDRRDGTRRARQPCGQQARRRGNGEYHRCGDLAWSRCDDQRQGARGWGQPPGQFARDRHAAERRRRRFSRHRRLGKRASGRRWDV